MLNNVIGDCPMQCDVGPLDFMDDYRKDLIQALDNTTVEKTVIDEYVK